MKDKRVGITTTLPVEAIFAAGRVPVDLNNAFISGAEPNRAVDRAEACGLPASTCAWIKGIYATVMRENFPLVICVTGGDCSNTVALMELLVHEGKNVETFDYPYNRDARTLEDEIQRLCSALGTSLGEAQDWFDKLKPIRDKLRKLDEMTWRDGLVTGAENHEWLVSASDFEGNPADFEKKLDAFVEDARARKPKTDYIPLAFAGVPPVIDGLYEHVELHGGKVVLNEFQRAFALPWKAENIVDAYRAYTYPYSVFHRLEDLKREIAEREIRGVIHYVQHSCHRQIADAILRRECGVPVLTLEGDRPAPLSEQFTNRIEAFLEMAAS